jgi:hypothetical protein
VEILVTSLLLFGTAATLALLRVVRPQFRFGWLLAVAGTAGAWLSVLFWLPQLPVSLNIPLWQSAASADSYATFLVTDISWPYALSLTTLALAVVLTAPSRASFPSPSTWALSVAVVGLGLLGAVAESPLTLVLLWAGLDLVEAGVVLARPEGQGTRLHWPLTFTLRLGSMALVLLGLVLGQTDGSGAGFGAIQGAGAMFLPAAGLLRLAAFAAPGDSASSRDGVRVVLHLTASVAAIAFLSQLSPAVQPGPVLLSVACAFVALYAGWMWLRGPDVSLARPLWLMGMGSLAVAAMLRANPLGATAWGNAMLLAGSTLFLATSHERWVNRALLCAILFCTGLPLTLTAAAWTGGGRAEDLLLPAFLVAQAMLLAGFFHFTWTGYAAAPLPAAAASPLRGFYRSGIVLPLLVGLGLGFWGWPGALQLGSLAATAVVILATSALVWGKRRIGSLTPSPMRWTPRAAEKLLSAMGHELARLQDMLHRMAMTITRTLEGEAGILWSLVVLVLFASLIADRAR